MAGLIDKGMARLSSSAWQALAHAIGEATQGVGQPFRVLQRIQYGPPWRGRADRDERAADTDPARCCS